MKKLYLLRHAHSDSQNSQESDRARPLSPRGQADCKKIARYMQDNGFIPDAIYTSDATRTQQTANNISKLAGFSCDIELTRGLYLATPGEIIKIIGEVDGNVGSLMIVAHNPGIHALAMMLIKDSNADLLASISSKYPTAALSILDIDLDSWERLQPRSAYLKSFTFPKAL